MKIVETAPTTMPTMIANAKSCSVAPPKMNSATIGSSVITEVTIDRRSTSQTETFDDRRDARARHQPHVLADAVEDDDRVVDRVAEDRQHRGDGRRRSPRGPRSRRRRA